MLSLFLPNRCLIGVADLGDDELEEFEKNLLEDCRLCDCKLSYANVVSNESTLGFRSCPLKIPFTLNGDFKDLNLGGLDEETDVLGTNGGVGVSSSSEWLRASKYSDCFFLIGDNLGFRE